MTLNDFMSMAQKQVDKGYGDKDLVVEDAQENFHIHSIQMNTCPGIEPDYLLIMAGEKQEQKKE